MAFEVKKKIKSSEKASPRIFQVTSVHQSTAI